MEKTRAGMNRTIVLTPEEKTELKSKVVFPSEVVPLEFENSTICADILQALPKLPDEFADLIIIDPPYNLTKDFNGTKFSARSDQAYEEYLDSWLPQVCAKLKPTGSLYLCGD